MADVRYAWTASTLGAIAQLQRFVNVMIDTELTQINPVSTKNRLFCNQIRTKKPGFYADGA
ncbi:MAG: hypothetical protein HC773_04550 [Scytonema sp. CRU_2_7]|nr:hypothetical protein [Scytonema sp. CRU_2_7]